MVSVKHFTSYLSACSVLIYAPEQLPPILVYIPWHETTHMMKIYAMDTRLILSFTITHVQPSAQQEATLRLSNDNLGTNNQES